MPIIGYLVVFLYIFGWRIYSQLDLIQLISVAFGIYAVLNWKHRLARSSSLVLGLFALTFLYAGIAFVARSSTDLFPLFRIARSALTLLGGLGIAIFFEKRLGERAGGDLLKITLASVALHGMLMLTMYFSHGVRSLVYGITKGVQYANRGVFLGVNLADVGVRVMGLTYGLASTSLLQASAALQLPSLARHLRRPLSIVPLYFVVFICSAAIAGRSGLLVVALLAPPLIFTLLTNASTARAGAAIVLFALLSTPLFYFLGVTLAESRSQQFTYTAAHLGELVSVFTAPERSPVLNSLANQIILPSGASDILFGTGSFGRSGSYYLASDIGFVQHLFAYGIFGMFLLWSPLFCMLAIALRQTKGSPIISIGFALTVVASVLFNGKEESLYERCVWSFQILLWFSVLLGPGKTRIAQEPDRLESSR